MYFKPILHLFFYECNAISGRYRRCTVSMMHLYS